MNIIKKLILGSAFLGGISLFGTSPAQALDPLPVSYNVGSINTTGAALTIDVLNQAGAVVFSTTSANVKTDGVGSVSTILDGSDWSVRANRSRSTATTPGTA